LSGEIAKNEVTFLLGVRIVAPKLTAEVALGNFSCTPGAPDHLVSTFSAKAGFLRCTAKHNAGSAMKKFKRINLNTVDWQAQLLLQEPEDSDDVTADKDVAGSGHQFVCHLNFLPDQVGAVP